MLPDNATIARAKSLGLTLRLDTPEALTGDPRPVLVILCDSTQNSVRYACEKDGSFSFVGSDLDEHREASFSIKITSQAALFQLLPRISQNF